MTQQMGVLFMMKLGIQ